MNQALHCKLYLLSCLVYLQLVVCGCHQTDDNPYPSLSAQRAAVASKPQVLSPRMLDSALLTRMLFSLSADSCEGRAPGTRGHQRAQQIIAGEFGSIGLLPLDRSLLQVFTGDKINGSSRGANVVGWIKGRSIPGRYIVITAHYDHLGKDSAGRIYPGADDNASGVGGLVALAKYYESNPHAYSLIFVAFDREETGFGGSTYFVRWLKKQNMLRNVALNVNLDMIARSDKDELFVCGIRHNPNLRYLVDTAQHLVNVNLLMWHDDAGQKGNWTNLSDHYLFHQQKIPFLYLGVEDHPDYHKPGDRAEKINLSRYVENCNATAVLIDHIKNL